MIYADFASADENNVRIDTKQPESLTKSLDLSA